MLYFFLQIHMENKINVGDQNTQQIGQNPINQSPINPVPKKPKINYWIISTVILVIMLVIVSIFTLSLKGNNKSMNDKTEQKLNLSETPTPSDLSTNPNSQSRDDEVFLATAVDRFKYKIILYDRNTKQLKEKTVDFATTGLDIGLLMSRFTGTGGTESVHYNPNTGEIILVVGPISGGIAGYKPPEALPEPTFSYAVYKTTFNDKDSLTQLFSSKEQIPNNVMFNNSSNTLIYAVKTYQGAKIASEDIFEFDLKNKSTRKVTLIQTSSDNKEIVELSDLRMSQQGNKLYQLVLYGTQGFWTNQRLELKIVDLSSGTTETKLVTAGDDVVFSITGLSQDASRVVFYTSVNNERKLQLKSLSNNTLIPISPSEDIKNLNLFISGSKNQVLYGTDSGWIFFDADTKRSQKTTITRPFIWSPSNDYIVGTQGEKIVIYDTQRLTTIDLGLNLSQTEINSIEVAQWK